MSRPKKQPRTLADCAPGDVATIRVQVSSPDADWPLVRPVTASGRAVPPRSICGDALVLELVRHEDTAQGGGDTDPVLRGGR